MTVSITTDGQAYSLGAGQTLTSIGSADEVRSAIRVDAQNVSLAIAGTVNGGSDTGILLDTGPRIVNPDPFAGASIIYYFFDRSSMAVTVAAGGVVSGYYGIYARLHPNNLDDPGFGGVIVGGGSSLATVDNSGSILATAGGYALYSSFYPSQPVPSAGFASVINRAGGLIGAIEARVDTLTNAGTIDGGARSAIKGVGANVATMVIDNSGLITSAATAIQSGTLIRLTNAAGGTVTGNGGTAIAADGGIVLVNAGTINGDVHAATRPGGGGNFIDNSNGTIIGNVSLGSSNDIFVARLGAGGTVFGVTGSLDGGGGIDSLGLIVNGSVSTALAALPTNFERLRFELNDNASLTVTSGTAEGIQLSGRGTFTNAATISGTAAALSAGPSLANPIQNGPPTVLRNSGILTSTFNSDASGSAAVAFKGADVFEIVPQLSWFENSGSITSNNGRGVVASLGGVAHSRFENTGSITGTNGPAIEATMVATALNEFVSSGTVNGTTVLDFRSAAAGAVNTGVNSGRMEAVGEVLRVSGGDFSNDSVTAGGTIVSTGSGIAAAVRFSSTELAHTFRNSGSVTSTGVAIVLTDASLENTGTITSTQQEAVTIEGGSYIVNSANGILRGGNGVAIRLASGFTETPVNIINDGLIDGDAILFSNNSENWILFYNDGVVTGDVRLGVANDSYVAGEGSQRAAYGGFGNDLLYGGFGDDLFYGEQGDDELVGGAGNDVLIGGTGNDLYQVDRQGDIVIELAGEGRDTVSASASFYLYANIEVLTLDGVGDHFGVGNADNNVIIGNNGSNLLLGGAGNDNINGLAGVDSLFGEAGNDLLFGDVGVDYLVGGIGNDTLLGGDDPDALYGENGDDVLDGGDSFHTDILVGGTGNDTLDGASGLGDYDLMDGGAGDDFYLVDKPDDLTFEAAGGGVDTVSANINGAGYYLYANTENLILEGSTPFGVGNELANELTGNLVGNYLLGGLGNDLLNGGEGNDVLFGEGGADTFVFDRGTGGDVIGDFEAGIDKISLFGLGFASYAALQPNIFQVGGNTGINLGFGDFIVLNGVTNAQLSASDFLFG